MLHRAAEKQRKRDSDAAENVDLVEVVSHNGERQNVEQQSRPSTPTQQLSPTFQFQPETVPMIPKPRSECFIKSIVTQR